MITLDELIKNLLEHNKSRKKDVYICIYTNEIANYLPIELGSVSTYGDNTIIFINRRS